MDIIQAGLFSAFLKKTWNNIRDYPTYRLKKKREKWESEAVWYRLRYSDAQLSHNMLERLSQANCPIAFHIRTQTSSSVLLVIGIPQKYASILERMAPAFSCDVSKCTPPNHWAERYAPRWEIPGDRNADGYIVSGKLFLSVTTTKIGDGLNESNGSNNQKTYIFPPEEVDENSQLNGKPWKMPEPALGLSTTPILNLQTPHAMRRKSSQVLLGWDANSLPVGARRAQVMGNAQDHWLDGFVVSSIRENREGLLVIDGDGKWLDRFLKKRFSASMVNRKRIVVMDVLTGTTSINPLAHVPDNQKETAVYWRWWLEGLGIPPETIKKIVPQAILSNVQSVKQLYRWVQNNGKLSPDITTPMRVKLEQLLKDKVVSEWIAQENRVSDPAKILMYSHLFVTPRITPNNGYVWTRQNALRGLLGLIVRNPNITVVLRNVPLHSSDISVLSRFRNLVLVSTTHAPIIGGRGLEIDTTIITRSTSELTEQIISKIPFPPEVTAEHIEMLPYGSAICVSENNFASASWGLNAQS